MTDSSTEKPDNNGGDNGEGISDDQLPEDLQPSEDNPLAEPLSEDDAPDDIDDLDMQGGKEPVEWDDEQQED